MSFGYGVGDILTVIGLANKLRRDFSNAPEQYQAISSEVKNCSLVLQEIDAYLEAHDVSDFEVANLRQIVTSSNKTLKHIEQALAKYTNLETRQDGLRERMRRVWQQVKWEPQDIRDFRSRLNASVIQLNALAGGLNRQNVVRLVEWQVEQTNREILDWLAPPDSQHADYAYHRLPDTRQWFINSLDYRKWRDPKDSAEMLMLSGIPGTGKTVLSSIIIDDLQELCGTEINVRRVCYYYCDYNRLQTQQLDAILLHLLRQLVQGTSALPTTITKLYGMYSRISTRPSIASIKEAIREVISRLEKVYIVIDALDESQVTNGLQRTLLAELLELNKLANVNLLITSRPLPYILNALGEHTSIQVRASDTDIAAYVSANILHLPAFVGRQPTLQDEIRDVVITASDGIFLLATLYIRSLESSISPRHLRNIMESFSNGAPGYSEAYSKTMARILSQERKQLAIDSLTWTVHAERLLTCEELVHALATEPDEAVFHEDNIPDIEDVLSACCGLLVVEERTSLVRLVHRTAQEYFKQDGQSWLLEPHTKLSKVCDAYLGFMKPVISQSLSDEAFKDVLFRFPLYNYASLHWLQHAKLREIPITIQDLLTQQQQVNTSSQTFLGHLIPKYLEVVRSTPGVTGLHLVAYHGLVKELTPFLQAYDINSLDNFHNTPLYYAIERDHGEIAVLLISSGARTDIPNSDGKTSLHLVMEGWPRDATKVILENLPNPTTARHQGEPLLYHAIRNDQLHLVQVLLDRGCDACYIDEGNCSLFIHAIRNCRNTDIPKLLADRGADWQYPDSQGRVPLSHAVEFRDKGMCQFLFDLASEKGDSNAMKIQALSKDKYGLTPFMYAAKAGNMVALDLLLESGANIDDYDNDKITALMHAINAEQGDTAVWLLYHGANQRQKSSILDTSGDK